MSSKVLELMARAAGRPVEELSRVDATYPFALSPFLARRVEEGTYSLEALRQYLPDARELDQVAGYVADPTGEGDLHPEESILQTYDNRLAMVLTHQCLVYCRFCFRKDFVGFPEHQISNTQLEQALAYVTAHTEIEDVLLSGGDPLAMPNRRLIPFLKRLIQIPHLKAIRIHSRAVATVPSRIDNELLDFLSQDDRFWYYSHMNHPDDIDHPEVIAAIRRLLSARIPVLNQGVILGGVNDNPVTMTRLMQRCYENKVIPYNLYVLDRVKGAAHFEVPIERIVEIYKALSRLPGPAQPVLVYVDGRSKKHRAVYSEALDLKEFLSAR